MVTSLFFVGLGAVFFYLLAIKDASTGLKQSLKVPFICFCSTIFIAAAFAPIRTIVEDAKSERVVEYWGQGLQLLMVGICVVLLAKVFFDESAAS